MQLDTGAGLLLSAIRDSRFLVGLDVTVSFGAHIQPEQNLAEEVRAPSKGPHGHRSLLVSRLHYNIFVFMCTAFLLISYLPRII